MRALNVGWSVLVAAFVFSSSIRAEEVEAIPLKKEVAPAAPAVVEAPKKAVTPVEKIPAVSLTPSFNFQSIHDRNREIVLSSTGVAFGSFDGNTSFGFSGEYSRLDSPGVQFGLAGSWQYTARDTSYLSSLLIFMAKATFSFPAKPAIEDGLFFSVGTGYAAGFTRVNLEDSYYQGIIIHTSVGVRTQFVGNVYYRPTFGVNTFLFNFPPMITFTPVSFSISY